MGEITQEVNFDIVEKLPDGNFKIKYPKTVLAQIKELSGIATKSEAEAGTGDTQVMTPLRVKEAINASRMSVKVGTCSHGATIPQTAGYTNYLYYVSVRSMPIDDGGLMQLTFYENNRIVTASDAAGGGVGIANYIEFAWN